MTIDVITAIAGRRDDLLRPVTEPAGVRFRAYVDVARVQDVPPWEVRPIDIPDHLRQRPREASRIVKILGHLHVPTGPGAEREESVYIWQDACARLFFRDAEAFLHEFLGDADIAVIGHERRDHRTEQAYCLEHRVGDTGAIAAQLDRYETEGFSGCPFVCGGLIARRHNERTVAFNELWWKEYRQGQERDQFSLAYSLWRAERDFGLRVRVIHPSYFGGTSIWQNPWFEWHKHARRCATGTGWKI